MKIHCFKNSYIYEGEIRIVFNRNQFTLLQLFSKYKSLDKVVENAIGNQNVSKEQYDIIQNNISTFINDVLERVGKNALDSIELTGEYGKCYPRVLTFELTNYCNFYCGHCYKNASCKNKTFLNYSIIENIVQKYKGKVQLIHLTGGEPLSHPKIKSIIDLCLDNGFLVNITTNGSLGNRLTDEHVKKINNFQISLYGYNKQTYLQATGVDGFESVRDFIKRLENMKISYNLSFLANKLYLQEHKEYNMFINSLNYHKMINGTADNQGRYGNSVIWQLNEEEKALAKAYMEEIKRTSEDFEELLRVKVIDDETNCQAGTLSYSINENGDVFPCQALSDEVFRIGNLDDLEENINNNDKFDIYKIVKRNLEKVGGICKYKGGSL